MSDRGHERGFTLIEVLVALAVLGLVLTAVFRIYGTGVLNVGRGIDELRLALAAEAVLARTRLDLDPRQRQAEGSLDGIDWRMEARPMPMPRPVAGPARSAPEPTGAPGNLAQGGAQLWEVRVIVAAAGRNFELTSIRWLSSQ
jgi:prepilin-type N-terminal cleavage/methylation domain-containing protein